MECFFCCAFWCPSDSWLQLCYNKYAMREFDSVRRSTLMQKMAVIDLPDSIYNWIANYFEQRGHVTKIHDIISVIAFINASIIQGSVIGPPSYMYVVAGHWLHPTCVRSGLLTP